MNCPNCANGMTNMMMTDRVGGPVEIDVCANCHAFWFDKYESLKLSAGSTLRLMKFIGESSTAGKSPFSETMSCPRCRAQLRITNDMQRSTRFSYFRCPTDHGRFIRFFEFLREKNFIKPLSAEQVDALRQSVQSVNCSNCGAPIDLTKSSACGHCGSALSMLDMQQSEKLLKELKDAAEPKPIDPDLPLKLAWAKREAELQFGRESNADMWGDLNTASGLVEDGLNAVARWLNKTKLL